MARSQRIKRGIIDWDAVHDDDVALLARFGDREAVGILWHRSIGQTERIAGLFIQRYPWISHEDLTQEVLSEFPKMLRRYKPHVKTGWNKYAYHVIYRMCQDALRREDPLGVGIPHRMHYPFFRRFSELDADGGPMLESEINGGVQRLRDGMPANLSPDPPPRGCGRRLTKNNPQSPDCRYHGPRFNGRLMD